MKKCRKIGLSLVEVLLVISIASVLACLVVVAVQKSRETANRMACSSQMRQIAMALQSYQSRFAFFPCFVGQSESHPSGYPISGADFSPLVRMLPDLELAPWFDHINFVSYGNVDRLANTNSTIVNLHVSLFICPSDRPTHETVRGPCSYRFCHGPSVRVSPGFYPNDPCFDGPFTVHFWYRPADFPDGLSKTIGISERTLGDWQEPAVGPGDARLLEVDAFKDLSGNIGQTICRGATAADPTESRGGETWFYSSIHATFYNHVATPNWETTDCYFSKTNATFSSRLHLEPGVISARSRHTGGVNACFMDGSHRFVSDSIDQRVWRAMSTRNHADDGFN